MIINALTPQTGVLLIAFLCKSILLTGSRNVQQCPLTYIAWVKRGTEIGCKETDGNFYHCYRNNEEQLIEECRGFLEVTNTSGVCPYFKSTSNLGYTSCSGGCCPKGSDPPYFTYELYKYPNCLHPENSSAAESFKYQTSETSEETTPWFSKRKMFGPTFNTDVVSVVGVVTVNMLVVLVVCIFIRRRTAKLRLRNSALDKDERRSHIYNSIQEIEILQTGSNEENESTV